MQLESAHRRLKTTFKVGTPADKQDLEGIGESQDLARLLIGAFYQSRVERKGDARWPAGKAVRTFAAEGGTSGSSSSCAAGGNWLLCCLLLPAHAAACMLS